MHKLKVRVNGFSLGSLDIGEGWGSSARDPIEKTAWRTVSTTSRKLPPLRVFTTASRNLPVSPQFPAPRRKLPLSIFVFWLVHLPHRALAFIVGPCMHSFSTLSCKMEEIGNVGELDGRRELNQFQKFLAKVGFTTMVFSASGILWTTSMEHGLVSTMHLSFLYILLVLGSWLVLLSVMLPLAAGLVRPATLVALALSLFFGGYDELFL